MRTSAIILIICILAACKHASRNAITNTPPPAKKNQAERNFKDSSKNSIYDKLSCDSLMILLIKSSSIDKRIFKYRAGIDSIKNRVVYLSFSFIDKENGSSRTGYFLQVDLNKQQMRGEPEQDSILKFDKQIFDNLMRKKCYNADVDYVTN